MSRSRRVLGAGLLVCAGALSIPAAGHAASLTVTNDAGAAVPLGPGATIRNMSPEIEAGFTSEELSRGARFALTVEGPGGVAAITPVTCTLARNASSQRVSYRGNGAYRVRLSVYPPGGGNACGGVPQETTVDLTINAFTGVGLPPEGARLLTRPVNDLNNSTYEFPLDINPGSTRTQVTFARGAKLTDGTGPIQGKPREDTADSGTSHTSISFFDAGDYTMLSQATGSDGASPYSSPLRFRVQEPFDLSSVFISRVGERRARYRLRGSVRTDLARKKRVVVSLRRQGAKRFRRIGTTRITGGDRVRMAFRLGKRGRYTLRLRTAGAKFVRGGRVDYPVRFTRRDVRVGDPVG